jgi:hypothetical protein
MIDPLIWHQPFQDEYKSPFQRGEKERRIRITFYPESLFGLSETESKAYDVLIELCALSEIDAMQIGEGVFKSILYDDNSGEHNYIDLKVSEDLEIQLYSGISRSRVQANRIQFISDRYSETDPEFINAKHDLFAVEAHHALGRDIFVTTSPRLLCHRDVLAYANIRTPLEALKIIGLFLRSRDNWKLRVKSNYIWQSNSSQFYRQLALFKLPNMWKYNGLCQKISEEKLDDTGDVSESILIKCARALQAKDIIGIQFYLPKSNSAEDTITYHFDYLTLLLHGCLDSQALIANRIYKAVKKEDKAKFHYDDFLKNLRVNGAGNLCDFLGNSRFKNFDAMLRALRNTVHDANIPSQTEILPSEEKFDLIVDEFTQELGNAIGYSRSNCDRWGLKRQRYVSRKKETKKMTRYYQRTIEPYTFATTLVETTLEVIDTIAALTELECVLKKSSSTLGVPPRMSDLERIGLLG